LGLILNNNNHTSASKETATKLLSSYIPKKKTGKLLQWLKLVNQNDYQKLKHASINALQKLLDTANDTLKSVQKTHDKEIKRLLSDKAEEAEKHEQVMLTAEATHAKQLAERKRLYVELINDHCKKHLIPSPFYVRESEYSITQKKPLRFSQGDVNEFLAALKKVGIEPDPDQKKVLFTHAPAVCVSAGAGAGKSSTLASRVAFLNLIVGIPLNKIAVTTFTRESRKEFIEKVVNLINTISSDNILNNKAGESVVKTFHGLAYLVNKQYGDSAKKIIYKERTPKFESDDGQILDIDNLDESNEDEMEHDESIPPLSTIQANVYKQLYSSTSEIGNTFKTLIDKLFLDSFKNTNNQNKTNLTSSYYHADCEDALSDLVFDDWVKDNQQDYDQLFKPFKVEGRKKVNIKGVYLNYHFELPNLKAKVYVSKSAAHYHGKVEYEEFKGKKYSLSKRMGYRRWFVFHKSSTTYLHIENPADLIRLIDRENMINSTPLTETAPPPTFNHICIGERGKKDPSDEKFKAVYTGFYELSNFVYSLGKRLGDCTEDDLEEFFSEVPSSDLTYFKAAIIFNRELEQELSNQGFITFEQIFHEFSDPDHPILSSSDLVDNLSWCEHLLIDEFQDISPNIINFFNNIKRIYHRTTGKGTFLCVGDANQSIYGWRGSSCKYIKNPEDYFPTNGGFVQLSLNNNYRSSSKVVDVGKHGLRLLGEPPEFTASGPLKDCKDSSFNIVMTKKEMKNEINYDHLVESLSHEIERTKASKDNPIYVLYKNHDFAQKSDNQNWHNSFLHWKKKGYIKPLTIHTSKGLEANSIFILGDIARVSWNPLKNRIYAWCEIGGTYDNALQHEAVCLSYVAVTRAKKNIHWYLSKQDNGLGQHYLPLADSIAS